MFRVFVLVLVSLELSAQNFNAAPYLSMGNTGIAQEGIYSLSSNPSGMARLESVAVGMAYQQHFNVSDLSSQALYLVVPAKQYGHFGVHLRQYGIRQVSKLTTGSLSYGRNFGGKIQTSISINIHQYAVENYVNAKAMSGDLGLQYLTDRFIVGLHYRNISNSHFSREIEQRIPHELTLGGTYLLSSHVHVSADLVREFPHQVDFRAGLEYQFDHRFVIRGGASTQQPTQYFAGAGIHIDKLQVDIASSFHARLGASPQLALSYAF